MYETQESVPVRDWLTLGGVLLGMIVVIFLAVTVAQNSSSSIQVVSGQIVTAQPNGSPQSGSGNSQDGNQTQNGQKQGGSIATAKDQKNINQLSFFEVFLLLLFGAALFTVILSVLIALLVFQLTKIFKKMQKNKPE